MSGSATESDSSDEFFDAEDTTPSRITKKRSPIIKQDDGFVFPEPEIKIEQKSRLQQEQRIHHQRQIHEILQQQLQNKSDEFLESKSMACGRQRFRELRQCMQNDDDENPGNTLTPDSQNSSVEGVFAAQRPSHPFRIIESDAQSLQSMTSLGRVGRILSGSIDPTCISLSQDFNQLSASTNTLQIQAPSETEKASAILNEIQTLNRSCEININENPNYKSNNLSKILDNTIDTSNSIDINRNLQLQEPDVIASTKLAHSKTTDSLTPSGPIAPPRRKKKNRKLSTSSSEQFTTNDDAKSRKADCNYEDEECFNLYSKNSNQNLKDFKAQPEISNNISCLINHESTAGIESLTRQLEEEYSFTKQSFVTIASTSVLKDNKKQIDYSMLVKNDIQITGSMGRICHSLGNSSISVNSKQSPSNSSKSNSAPGRVRQFYNYNSSIDPNQGLNIYKATRGKYVVKPQDEVSNKAEGPSEEEMERIQMIRSEIMSNTSGLKFNVYGTGTNSLGSGARYANVKIGGNKERRKSAGDEDALKQANLYVRTRTDSGKQLTDLEILEQVPVKNLDTGENFPLSAVEEKMPQYLNPLSLHIMRLTSHIPESDEESVGLPPGSDVHQGDEEDIEIEDSGRLRKKTARLKRFFGSTVRKTVDKAKSIANEVSHARHKEDVADIVDVVNPEQNIKIKASSTNKGPYDFAKLQHVQDLSGEHTGAVWCMKFSSCGRLLATAGQDKVLRIWVLKDAYPFFQDMRTKYNADQKSSPTPSQESLVSHNSAEEAIAMAVAAEKTSGPFMPKAFCTYTGHTSDLLDVSWSKNYFILSSSMDKTVRLWHISRKECLCCFQHIDFVTAIAFHPRDDRYFLSGSLDGKLRLWNIPDKKVALWNEVDGHTKLITAANFCQNGKFAVVGSYDGRCIFYNTDQLKYHTQIHVRSTRGKNATGRKISGIEPMPGEDKILVTSNDSRIRLYDLRDLNLSCKYKGYLNVSSQIKGSFSNDGKYIISGSENQCIFIWKTHHDYSKLSSVRRDRSDFWEGIKAHNATVTCAIFAPHPEAIIKPEFEDDLSDGRSAQHGKPDPLVEQRKKGCGYALVSADFNGAIKVFINKTKPKHSSLPYTAILD